MENILDQDFKRERTEAIIVYYLIQSITYSIRLLDYIRRGHNLGVEREDLLTMV